MKGNNARQSALSQILFSTKNVILIIKRVKKDNMFRSEKVLFKMLMTQLTLVQSGGWLAMSADSSRPGVHGSFTHPSFALLSASLLAA